MKVFLDTNVLASAFGTRGLCADVLRAAVARHELVISQPLLRELRRVLREKFGAPRPAICEAIRVLEQDAIVSSASPTIELQLKDKSDLAILSSAVNGGAQILVTGDKELLALVRVEKLRILSPREFWEWIKRRPRRSDP